MAASTFASGDGGNLTVNASSLVQAVGLSADGQFPSGILAQAERNSTGRGGNLTINANQLIVRDGGLVSAQTYSAGQGGDLTVNASDSVQLTGKTLDDDAGSALATDTHGSGAAGNLTINTRQLLVQNGATVSASANGTGRGGALTVNASDSVEVIGIRPTGQYTGGLFAGSGGLTPNTPGLGVGGDLTINTRQLIVRDGAFISTSADGDGQAGKLTVNASDSVEVIGTSANQKFRSSLLSNNTPGSSGAANDLTINTRQLIVRDGGLVSTEVGGAGQGGKLTVNASDSVTLIGRLPDYSTGSALVTGTSGSGSAGDLTISTRQLQVLEGAIVSSGTNGTGRAGTLTVNASDSVEVKGISPNGEFIGGIFSGSGGLSAPDVLAGAAGDLLINTRKLTLEGGAKIGSDAFSAGQGGKLTINASESVNVIGTSVNGFRSTLTSQTNSLAAAGDLTINTRQLVVRDGGLVSAQTYGAGQGGNLTVNASDSVALIGTTPDYNHGSALNADTYGSGAAGDLIINTRQLRVFDGATVSASTQDVGRGGALTINATDSVELKGVSPNGESTGGLFAGTGGFARDRNQPGLGAGGDLTINTRQLIVEGGMWIDTNTVGTGQAGNLTVNASESVQVIGTSANGRYSSSLLNGTSGSGAAGDLTINTSQLNIKDRATVNVSSEGMGRAGNINITAGSILLSNQGSIRASTDAGNGGNIRLKVADSLTLRYNSEIVAEAFGTANGGNINIDAGSYILGVLSENSDIVADASQGQGGTISATAPGIFGFREFIGRRTPESDFTASSAVGLNGAVEIKTQDKLQDQVPINFVDGTRLIDRHCTPPKTGQERSSFTITGRGGLPPSPNDTLQSDSVVTKWVALDSDVENKTPPATATPESFAPKPLVEAQGWYLNEKGEVVLTASVPRGIPNQGGLPGVNCDVSSNQGK